LKLKCVVIDDEFLARQLLEGYIQKISFLELTGSYESGMQALPAFDQQQVDLLFLDINMPELTGINFIKALTTKPEIIITSAHSEHALEGYQLDVIEYLLKPIYFDRFVQAVNKAKSQIQLKRKAENRPEQDANDLRKGDDNSIFIKTGPQKIARLFLGDILYIESMHEYIRIHTKNESHTVYHSLKSLLDVLPPDFVQIHRSYIVNFNHITVLEGNVVRIGAIELNVGKNFKDDLMSRVRMKSLGVAPPRQSE